MSFADTPVALMKWVVASGVAALVTGYFARTQDGMIGDYSVIATVALIAAIIAMLVMMRLFGGQDVTISSPTARIVGSTKGSSDQLWDLVRKIEELQARQQTTIATAPIAGAETQQLPTLPRAG